jgi:hypothetical protein
MLSPWARDEQRSQLLVNSGPDLAESEVKSVSL